MIQGVPTFPYPMAYNATIPQASPNLRALTLAACFLSSPGCMWWRWWRFP